MRIVADFESFYTVWFQPVGSPDTPHAGLADSRGPSHTASAPVSSVVRFLLSRHADNLICVQGPRTAWARRFLLDASHARFQKPLPQPRHRVAADFQPGS